MLKNIIKKFSELFIKKAKPPSSQEVPSNAKPSREVEKNIQAIIGLDFGTAYTKAAVRVGARDVYFVKFDEIPGVTDSFLLPCVMSVDQSGELTIGMSDKVENHVSQLKLNLMKENIDHDQKVLTVLFLAYVLAYIKAWFMDEHGKNYLNREFEWYLNIGVPAESWHDVKLCDRYTQICRLAWHLSLCEDVNITYKNAESIVQEGLDRCIDDDDLSEERIGLIPEFVAQIASYTRSPRRESGLHFLVDIGAATLDAVTFNVWDDGVQDQFPIYISRVRPLGTHFLCKHLIKQERQQGNDLLYEGYLCFNNDLVSEVLSKYAIADQKAEELYNSFKIKIRGVIYDVLSNTRSRRDPRSIRWKDGVPAFICGGGAHIPLYQECVTAFNRSDFKYRLKIRPMNLPTVASNNPIDASRLTVAYGLSFDKDDLGRIVPEHEIPDFSANHTVRNVEESYVSKDQV